MNLRIHPLTSDRWHDFVSLFGPRGACGGCWCQYWRRSHAVFERNKGSGNRAAMRRLVKRGVRPGLIAYQGRQPVGWCSLGPRTQFTRLKTARILKPVDNRPVWSVVCLFVARDYRRRGVSAQLIRGAVEYAGEQGAETLEGYPHDPTVAKKRWPDPFVWTGLYSSYAKAGFREVARRSPSRPVMRCEL